MPFYLDDAKRFAANFVVVSITATITKTITAPIDRIKLILQNQNSALQVLKGERQKYTGIIDCLIRFPKEQGFLSYWRGNGTNILRYFPTQALNFSFNDYFKKILHMTIGTDSNKALIKFLSGGFAGACATTIMYPLEFCQTRIAVDIGSDCCKKHTRDGVKREFGGLGDCIRKIKVADGFRGFYSGYPVAVMGISLYRALYFGLFDNIKHFWAKSEIKGHQDAPKLPIMVALLSAQSVTCISGVCTYPLDTVARRLMLESGRPKDLRLFNNSWGAFKIIYQKEGIFAFYRGALTNCLRGISGALVLVFYDEVLHYTKWKDWISPCDNC